MTTTKTTDRIGVFIASAAGVRPTLADYDPNTQAVSWSVVAGSGLWSAHLVSNLGKQDRRIQDTGVTFNGNRQVEIWKLTDDPDVATDDPDFQERLLFWGEMLGISVRVQENGEAEDIFASIQPYHFGNIVTGQRVLYQPTISSTLEDSIWNVAIPIEFQPQVDGKTIDNRYTHPLIEAGDYRYFWIDPESTRNANAIAFQGGTVSEWTLATAVESMCLHFNPSETFIDNAPHTASAAMMASAQLIKNIVLGFGHYLPQYLDAITHQLGFGWVVDIKTITDEENTHYPEPYPTIRFYEQQAGDSKTVKMQAPGEVLDLDSTNTQELDLQVSLGNLRNIITGNGGLIEREFTIPLYRTWETSDNDNYSHDNVNEPIGRKWFANEAGEYNGSREEIPLTPPNFGTGWIPKRRVIEDCITLRDDKRRPPLLEYRADDADSWKEVPNEWGYRILHNEIGIWWTGHRHEESTSGGIPEEMLTDTVELRITGTVRGDTRLTYTTGSSPPSPNSNDIYETIDLSDRYFDRRRQDTGDYASILTGPMDSKYDYSDLQDYIEEVQDKSDLADAQATVKLIGLHYSWDADGAEDAYKIGDIITKLEGREISFNRAGSPVGAKYLQVVGITWVNEPGNQSTILQLSPTGVS
jgi:hypothetical protein